MVAQDPLVSLDRVGVSYVRTLGFVRRTAFWALRNVSFDIYSGETLGIIGRNGAGKSTLLQLLAGIIRPDTGTVSSRDGIRAALLSLQVGFLPYLTGRENALLSGMLLGLRKGEMRSRLSAVEEFSELGEFFDQPLRAYSSGMLARLGFSVALQLEPDILLVDEVLGVGDAEFQRKSSAAMSAKIHGGMAVVLVSHSAPTVRQLCTRAILMEGGKLRAEGKTEEILKLYEGPHQ